MDNYVGTSLNATSPFRCDGVEDALLVVKRVMGAVALSLTSVTAAVFMFNKKLWEQHNIFKFHVVLSEWVATLNYAVIVSKYVDCFDGREKNRWCISVQGVFINVTIESILLVAGYHYFKIVVDPLGSEQRITKAKCVALCLGTWVISGTIVALTIPIPYDVFIAVGVLSFCLTTLATATCYALLYRAVSRTVVAGAEQKRRLEENKRVMKTFFMVYLTSAATMVASTFATASLFFDDAAGCLGAGFRSGCEIFILSSWILDCTIYWWRIKDFRNLLAKITGCMREKDTCIEPVA